MPPKRTKVDAAPMFSTWADADQGLARIARLNAIIGPAQAKAQKLQDQAAEVLAGVVDQVNERKQVEKNLEEFCRSHLPELLPAKSRHLPHGDIAFTASKECVVKKGFTIQAAVETMLAPLRAALDKLLEKAAKRYVRFKYEIDKAAALADFNAKKTTNDKLAALGLEITDKENFSYELPTANAQPTT